MAIRAQTIREIGLYDESFSHAYMDVEYSLRAQSMGWRLGDLPFIQSDSTPLEWNSYERNLYVYHPVYDELRYRLAVRKKGKVYMQESPAKAQYPFPPLTPFVWIEQEILATDDGFCGIGLFLRKDIQHQVGVLEINVHEIAPDKRILRRSMVFHASEFEDKEWKEVYFTPIIASKNKRYTISLRSLIHQGAISFHYGVPQSREASPSFFYYGDRRVWGVLACRLYFHQDSD